MSGPDTPLVQVADVPKARFDSAEVSEIFLRNQATLPTREKIVRDQALWTEAVAISEQAKG